MFSINLLSPDVIGSDGERRGKIVIGSHTERFPVYPLRHGGDLSAIEAEWAESLRELVNGTSSVALRTDPRFAWVLYREGQEVHVQQQCLVSTWEGSLNSQGVIESVPPRRILTEDGEPISEWHTTVRDIENFLLIAQIV